MLTLFSGTPDIIAVVAGASIPDMDAVIDRIAEIPEILVTDSKVARQLDGVEFPIKPRSRRASASGTSSGS